MLAIKKILLTGGAGFIGSNLVRHLLTNSTAEILNVDLLTYAGNLENLKDIEKHERYGFLQADIADEAAMRLAFDQFQPDAVMNLAAESHVDRSIDGPGAFVRTNIHGTFVLLEQARRFVADKKPMRFLHVSTDEVYGSLGAEGLFTEESLYAPNSPYSASKAAADHLVRAYHHTYGLDTVITNCSNNYGPFQFPEKLIPLMILNALEGKALPVYGDGSNIRDWLHVEDHCLGLRLALEKGKSGEKYNIGGRNERKNIDLVNTLCASLDSAKPNAQPYSSQITYVKDRPGHDQRYAIDADKIRADLGWEPQYNFESGMAQTVAWYLDHLEWAAQVQAGKYQRERLGGKS